MRSNWKGFFVHNSTTLDKSSILFNTMLKKKFNVHDGKTVKGVVIERWMIGLKMGEFIFTRKMGVLHKKKVIKKGKKK